MKTGDERQAGKSAVVFAAKGGYSGKGKLWGKQKESEHDHSEKPTEYRGKGPKCFT